MVAVDGKRGAVQYEPARTAAAEVSWPDWPTQSAYQHAVPPYPV